MPTSTSSTLPRPSAVRRPSTPPHPASTNTASHPRNEQSSVTWLLPFLLLVVATVVVPVRMLDEQGLPRYRALRSELADIQSANERARREVRLLKATVVRLRDDPAEIERIARDELGMLREGELMFQFAE